MNIDNCRFTPEEIGLERIVADGRIYIDVTPLYLDSGKSREVYQRIEEIKARRAYERSVREARKEAH